MIWHRRSRTLGVWRKRRWFSHWRIMSWQDLRQFGGQISPLVAQSVQKPTNLLRWGACPYRNNFSCKRSTSSSWGTKETREERRLRTQECWWHQSSVLICTESKRSTFLRTCEVLSSPNLCQGTWWNIHPPLWWYGYNSQTTLTLCLRFNSKGGRVFPWPSSRLHCHHVYRIPEYQHAEKMERRIGYVCKCSRGVPCIPWIKTNCPCRDKSVEENMSDFHKMLAGTYTGDAVVRVKTDMTLKNPALRDWPARECKIPFKILTSPIHRFYVQSAASRFPSSRRLFTRRDAHHSW